MALSWGSLSNGVTGGAEVEMGCLARARVWSRSSPTRNFPCSIGDISILATQYDSSAVRAEGESVSSEPFPAVEVGFN